MYVKHTRIRDVTEGEMICASRTAAGITQQQLADHLGVRREVIEWIEVGKMGFGKSKRSTELRVRLEKMVGLYPPTYPAMERF